MELLLILLYVSICYVVFKVFKIPINQWSLATAALGGIVGIVLLLLIMNYNHPFTTNARIYFSVTPVLPSVRGRVIEVPAQTNTPLKEGDVLFRVDPKPFEYMVAQKKASLAEAEQNVKQLKASLDQATAAADRTNAQFDLAQQEYNRQAQLFERKVVAQATLDTATRNLEASKQTWVGAKAEEERAPTGQPVCQTCGPHKLYTCSSCGRETRRPTRSPRKDLSARPATTAAETPMRAMRAHHNARPPRRPERRTMDLQPLLGSSHHDVHQLRPTETVCSRQRIRQPNLFDMQVATAPTTHMRCVRTQRRYPNDSASRTGVWTLLSANPAPSQRMRNVRRNSPLGRRQRHRRRNVRSVLR